MSTVRLRRIGRKYRNEHYRTISGIFHPQNECNISACAPLTFPSWIARKWLSLTCFVNVLSLNFLRKKETQQDSSTSDFVMCKEMPAWKSAVSEGGWIILRTEKRIWPICRAVRVSEGCKLVDFFGKRGNDHCNSLRSDAQQSSSCASWKTSEEESCHPSKWQREASRCTYDPADN